MIYNEYKDIRIAAIASAVQKDAFDIAAMADDPNEDPKYIKSFIRKTGITQKRIAAADQTASDFSFAAAKILEDNGKYKPEEIGILINLTQNPDYRTPSTACLLHDRLGLSKSCMAFDVNLGCSGFVYGVSIGAGMLAASSADKALIVMGDTQARGRKETGERSSNTRLLFGDASSAVLLEKSKGSCIRSGLMTDGTGLKAITSPYGAWRHPEGPELIPGDDIAVFNFTINEVPELVREYAEKTGRPADSYDAVVLHQANMMVLKNIAKRLGVEFEKCPVSIDRYGNTSSASVPLTISDKYGEDKDGKELSLLTSGFCIGLSWGVLDFTINTDDIYPVLATDITFDDGFTDQ
jgi:3-oxoacyl-[acyl-carrier-protein] synthase-3